MSSSTPTSIQPGWYEDPQAPGMLRWFDGVTWSPFTKPHATAARPAAVPKPRPAPAAAAAPHPAAPAAQPHAPVARPAATAGPVASQAVAHASGHSVAAARAALLAADSGPMPILLEPDLPGPTTPAQVAAAPAQVTARRPQVTAPAHPSPAVAPPAPAAAQATRTAAQGPPTAAPPVPARAATATSAATAAVDRLAATASLVAAGWPSTTAGPGATATAVMDSSAWAPAADEEPLPGAVRGPTGLRQAVGRLAESLPPWLPASVAGPLSLRMVRYATRTDRIRDRLTVEGLKRLVFPEETAWQASLAACLGVLTIALSVWPVVGLGAWLVTCTFAGLALLRLRQDVLLGGAERAWFAVACGVGPLCTGLLALAFR